MRHGCVFEIDPEEAADEQFGGCVGVGEFRGGGCAFFHGDFGTGGWDVGVASDLCGVVCGDGGVLGRFAEGGEEEGLRAWLFWGGVWLLDGVFVVLEYRSFWSWILGVDLSVGWGLGFRFLFLWDVVYRRKVGVSGN